MAGPEQPKVAPVECGELRLVEPLDDRQDRGVHKADVGVSIAVAKLADPLIIFGL